VNIKRNERIQKQSFEITVVIVTILARTIFRDSQGAIYRYTLKHVKKAAYALEIFIKPEGTLYLVHHAEKTWRFFSTFNERWTSYEIYQRQRRVL
jgi:hypothetical protein